MRNRKEQPNGEDGRPCFAARFRRDILVWWNEGIGWYGSKVPEVFREVLSAGRISVLEYSR